MSIPCDCLECGGSEWKICENTAEKGYEQMSKMRRFYRSFLWSLGLGSIALVLVFIFRDAPPKIPDRFKLGDEVTINNGITGTVVDVTHWSSDRESYHIMIGQSVVREYHEWRYNIKIKQ